MALFDIFIEMVPLISIMYKNRHHNKDLNQTDDFNIF